MKDLDASGKAADTSQSFSTASDLPHSMKLILIGLTDNKAFQPNHHPSYIVDQLAVLHHLYGRRVWKLCI